MTLPVIYMMMVTLLCVAICPYLIIKNGQLRSLESQLQENEKHRLNLYDRLHDSRASYIALNAENEGVQKKLKEALESMHLMREEIERSLENVKVYDDLRVKYNQLRDCCKNLQRQIRDETYGTVTVTGPLSTDVIRND